MVLRYWFSALALVALSSGCKEQSLFDEGNGEGSGEVASKCPSQCLGDAARDFNGTAGGAGDHWRYLDDHRDRTWSAMTVEGGKMLGADAATAISSCVSRPAALACAKIPNALLVNTAPSTGGFDPAIEFKVDSKTAVEVNLRAWVPEAADLQQILVYRNSREDLIYAGSALPGDLFERQLTIDAIAGDRLLVVVAAAAGAGGASEVGLELFFSNTGSSSKCQVAVNFEQPTGNAIAAQCGANFDYLDYDNASAPLPPVLAAGPYPELGSAGSISIGKFFKGSDVLDKTGDFTLQYWMYVNALDDLYDAWPVSDLDLDNGGGIGNAVYRRAEVRLDTTVGSTGSDYIGANIEFPNLGKWQFVRVVHTGGKVSTCLNGKRVTSFDLPAGKLSSNFPLHLGKNVRWTPQVAAYNGLLDDVRAFSAALPCE